MMKPNRAGLHAVDVSGKDQLLPPCGFLLLHLFHPIFLDFSSAICSTRVISTNQPHLLSRHRHFAANPNPPSPPSSSNSDDLADLPYGHEEALVFRQERDEARRELGEVSKQFGIEQAEWEDQRKQFCDAITCMNFLFRFLSLFDFARVLISFCFRFSAVGGARPCAGSGQQSRRQGECPRVHRRGTPRVRGQPHRPGRHPWCAPRRHPGAGGYVYPDGG